MPLKILVYDEGAAPTRALENAKAFASIGADVFLWDSRRYCRRSPNWDDDADIPQELDLLLLHDANASSWNDVKISEPSIFIRYTGGKKRGEGFWLHGTDRVSQDDARDIVDWATAWLLGDRNRPLPRCMKPAPSIALLGALSILCQGFLAVHADSTGQPEMVPEKDIADVHVALGKMQWPDLCRGGNGRELLVEAFRDDSPQGPEKRSPLRVQVLNADYWQPLINASREQNRRLDVFIESVKSEWDALSGDGNWGEVKTLLTAIWDSPARCVGPGIVARAFVQLANRLGGA